MDKFKNTIKDTKGDIGEQLIAQFFDNKYSRFFSFPNPKTKTNAEIADVIIWKNRVVLLVEVKTRDEGPASINEWAKLRTQEAVEQIDKNYKRVKSNEVINLHNSYYHTTLDCMGITSVIGLIVLVHDEKSSMLPKSAVSDIYDKELPIHVISWNDLVKMTTEIDTVSDFEYYLNDRFTYLQISDIPLGSELNVLGCYKTSNNKFPCAPTDYETIPYWEIYCSTMVNEINKRSFHNRYSSWIDNLESIFSDQRRLFHRYPIGLYFAWEIGSINRRERAYLGEKLDTVQDWFNAGNSTRTFAILNGSTGNWLVFYYSKSEPNQLHKELLKLVELKLVKEIHDESFEYGVYGFGLHVSATYPPQLLGLVSAIVIGTDEKKTFTKSELDEAYSIFGTIAQRQSIKIEEYPKN